MCVFFVVLQVKTLTFSEPFLAFETTQHGSSINQSVCLSEFLTPQDSVPKGQVATQESNHKCENNPRMSKASISKNQVLGRATICKLGFLLLHKRFHFVGYYTKGFILSLPFFNFQDSPDLSSKYMQRPSQLFQRNSVVYLQTVRTPCRYTGPNPKRSCGTASPTLCHILTGFS